ncbi:hypothetical protein [uncultured Parabacteroides sp.]|uniref:hypothetical protein n=1 Tax=uncultured Parabacteroides sp. TaxID=512312 RepID=UPI00260BFECA|nr:hypothetical protein [uncultured Parabacteroides sp.]
MRSILIFICLIFSFGGQGQEEEKSQMWKVEISGALNNYPAWEVEPSVTFLPIPYVGITMGLLFCNTIDRGSYTGTSKDGLWFWDSDRDDPGCHFFALRPAIQLVTPAFKFGKDKDTGLSLVISPGLTIPLPVNQEFNIDYIPNSPGVWIPQKFDHIKNKGGKSLFYHIKGMLSLDINRQYILSAGYAFSNFDLYSGGRNLIVEGERLSMPKIRFMHSGFLSIGYRF